MIESPPTATTDDLVVDRLTWRPHGRLAPTLREVSLTLGPGERVLLVGASGSGKSTLLRALAGLLDETLGVQTGSVRTGGRPPGERPGSVGLLLQDPAQALVAEFSGRDAAFGPENRALPRTAVLAEASRSLDQVDFPYDADRPSTQLSGGEMQRLALAGALALRPSWLLLDEPTAMLDPPSADRMRAAVARVADEAGLGLVVVEHRLEGWAERCERLVVLGPDGAVLADGPMSEVLRDRAEDLLAAGIWVPGAPTPHVPRLGWPPLEDADRPPREPLLRLDGLAVSAPGSSSPAPLVDEVAVQLDGGEALAVVGPSGSGKSTLLRTVAGMRTPECGTVDRPGRLGWVPQHSEQIITRRTVRQEVLATSEAIFAAQPDRSARAQERAEAILAGLGLDRLAEADPYQLSGGEQRRLALATAVVHAPELLLLDEPTVGQDRQTWAAVGAVIATARAEGSAVVVSTHDPLLVSTADQVLRLGGGPIDHDSPAPRTPSHTVAPVLQPGSPVAARCNPLALLIIGVGAAVGSFFVRDWLVGLLTLLLGLLLAPLAVRRVRPALVRLIPVGLAALTVGWSTLLFSRYGWFAAEAVPVAIREVLRIGCLVVPGALLLGVIRPSALGDALAQRLHAPHRVVVASTSALLRLDRLREEWHSLDEVRTIRGLAPGRSPVQRIRYLASMTVALLVWMLRSAQQMAVSMDARGFAGANRRTFALPSPWRGRDWCCCLVAVVFLAWPIVLGQVL